MNGRSIRRYINNVRTTRCTRPFKSSFLELGYCFFPWWSSFQARDILGRDAIPWITFPALRFLNQSIRPEWKIFEFGSGASTIFFARRCKEVYSVEHDMSWAEKVEAALGKLRLSNCSIRYLPPDSHLPTNWEEYNSHMPGYEHSSFQGYVRSIDEHPDRSIDLVLIDGRAREACIKHSVSKVRPGGILVLDNTERSRYNAAMLQIPNTWPRMVFPGPSARAEFFTETTVWIASVPKWTEQGRKWD